MPFKKFDKVILHKNMKQEDIHYHDTPNSTIVVPKGAHGMVEEAKYGEEAGGWERCYVRFEAQNITVWVGVNDLRPTPTVTHVAKRRSTLFDSYNTMNRKIIGEARELYRAEVLETQVDPVSGESYHRIKIHDGAFAEVEYAGEIWTRAWQWVKVKNTQVNQFGEFNKEGFQ